MSTNSTSERAWTHTRALALAREPGTHKHPTEVGLFIRVSPKGKAVWGYRFRDGFSQEQSGTLGPVVPVSDSEGGLSLEDAINRFRGLKGYHRTKATPHALTLQHAFDIWITDHRKKDGTLLADDTLRYYKRCYKSYLLEEGAADYLLAKTTTHEWNELLKKARERSPSQARGTMWMLHSIYDHFIDLEVIDRNPLGKKLVKSTYSGADTTKVVKTSSVATIDLPKFWANVEVLRNKNSRDAARLLTLLGWRKSCVLRMRWADIDFDKGVYNVGPDYHGWKRYEGPVVINDYALSYILERKASGGEAISEYVFPARHGEKPHMTDIRTSYEKASAGLGYRLTPHDSRRTFSTAADAVLSGNLRLTGFLIGHKKGIQGNEVTSGYVIRDLVAERIASNSIAEFILETAGVLPMSDEVAAILKKRGITPDQLTLLDMEDDDVDEEEAGYAALD